MGKKSATPKVTMTAETLSFQAEVSRLLDIVANSLYSHKEIFLRELISNASDACDRLRYQAIANPELIADDPEFRIRLSVDKAARQLSIADNGIGMNREELIENLGTIAQSGTAAFVEQLDEAGGDVTQIGQFGVGFYSAFMVADRVEVTSRRAGEAQVWSWSSDGKGSFSVSESDRELPRGTEVTLHLRKGEKDFLSPVEIRRVVTTYSDHIAIPILLAGEAEGEGDPLNQASALWTRPKSDITDEQYREFYHHVGHAFDDPWLKLHFKAEGVIEYTGLLFVPSARPFDLFHPERHNRLKLYVKRVFITDECDGLVPPYLRFVKGVIDSEDLPLNVSREMLQNNPLVAKIRQAVVKRILGELKRKAEKAPEDYAAFWRNFGSVLKEGVYEDESQRGKLLELARFDTTATLGAGNGDGAAQGEGATALVSLKDYVARMRDGQAAIYYITGEAPEALVRSPQLEGFAAKGVEVLLLSDPVDDFWLSTVPDYDGKPFKSVTRGAADLDAIEADQATEPAEKSDGAAPAADANLDALIAFVKLTLKDQVKDVRVSGRLTESPVCLVADEGDMDMHLERLLKQHRQIDSTSQRILEVNPGHALIGRLAERVAAPGSGSNSDLEDAARLLLDQALIMEGEPLPEPGAFARRLSRLVAQGLAPGGD
jgi:molecular chaperone HtpG